MSRRARTGTGMREGARSRGFTLVELLLSLVVLSGVVGASWLCLRTGLESRSDLEERADVIQNARVALSLMVSDLKTACPLSDDLDFLGMDRERDGREADNLDFATHNWSPQARGESDLAEVSYYVAASRRRAGETSLWRRRDPTPDTEPLDGGLREEIVAGVRGVRIEYYDGFSWYESWGPEEPGEEETERTLLELNRYGLPDAVRITIALASPSRSPSGVDGEGAKETTLVFRTVVFLALADRAWTASYAGGGEGDSDSPPEGPETGGSE